LKKRNSLLKGGKGTLEIYEGQKNFDSSKGAHKI